MSPTPIAVGAFEGSVQFNYQCVSAKSVVKP